jgi:hypothetical protein
MFGKSSNSKIADFYINRLSSLEKKPGSIFESNDNDSNLNIINESYREKEMSIKFNLKPKLTENTIPNSTMHQKDSKFNL